MTQDDEGFDWPRMYKWEENIERDVTDSVYEYVEEYFGVDSILELSEDQIRMIEAFRDEVNEYSPMQWGFSNLINHWESEQDIDG